MGACDFYNYADGSEAREVFLKIVDQSRWENGNGGYSGTIAEKSGFELRRSDAMTKKAAAEFAREDLGNNDKWGPAFAVKIKDVDKEGRPVIGFLFYGMASS